jgi:hypothetical protein
VPAGKKDLTSAHRSPRRGPLRCITHLGPPKGTLSSSTLKRSQNPCSISRQLRGAVCSPNLRGPKTRTPSTFRGRHMSARKPHSRPLPQAIVMNHSLPSHVLCFALSLLRGAVCSKVASKVGDLRPPTPVHLTGTSSDERNR